MALEDHPTVRNWRTREAAPAPQKIEAGWLRDIALECGADDVGFVAIDREEIQPQILKIHALMPEVKTLIAICCRLNRSAAKSTVRSVANHEFHETYDEVNAAARHLVRRLTDEGLNAMNAVAAFPMEMQKFPGDTIPIHHKPIAEAAGLGKMGLHRNVIHPKFGNFIVLDTVLLAHEVTEQSAALDYNPCLDCKLCVAACPVEAIGMDGSFNFSACYAHNYRDFMGGFVDWVDQVVEAKDRDDFRTRVNESETASVWQSLSFKPNYKAAYCVAVCPAGDDVVGHFMQDRIAYNRDVVQPFKDAAETVYVLPGSDAEESVLKRYPNKTATRVAWTLNAPDIFSFLVNLTLTFQRRMAKGRDVVCNLKLTGAMPLDAAIRIQKGALDVTYWHAPECDITVEADGRTFMDAFRHDFDLEDAIARGDIRVEGDPQKFIALKKCFARYGYLAPEAVEQVAETA